MVLVLPYVAVCAVVCVAAGRALDVMSVGRGRVAFAGTARCAGCASSSWRASSLGTAAIVSAVGLIGFVGIIVPHVVRLLVGTSYRRILPISVLAGAAFLVFADTVARTVVAPSELPLGVVTALVGAPVFVADPEPPPAGGAMSARSSSRTDRARRAKRDLVSDVSLAIEAGTWCTVDRAERRRQDDAGRGGRRTAPPSHGSVSLCGPVDLSELNERDRARIVSLVPQHPGAQRA